MNQTLALPVAPPRVDWRTPLELLALGAIWGGSFLFMRVAAPHFGPLALVEVRIVLGALFLLPFLWRIRARIDARLWLRFSIVGALNSAIPFTLFAWGAERAPAGVGAIANSLTVLFTALVGLLVYGDRIGARRVAAIAGGFVGVVVLASGKTAGDNVAAAAIAGAIASLTYGFAAQFTRRWFAEVPPLAAVAGTLGCSALMVAPFAVLAWPSAPPPPLSWLCAALLGVLCTGIAYAVFFRLIQRVGAARASTCTYLVPLFGVFWGWLLLGETPTSTMLAAGALILGCVVMSSRE
ncbi:MAG: EamA/RhaT family transporter [Lysobacteraceae bacterium]|nr:MAG: EamA/RhaT family transporter [Xanthomonadaceae bacterium]